MKQETIEAPAAEAALGLTIDRNALHEALALLCRVVERRNTIPILSYLLFEPTADASAVAITATDLDVQLTLQVPCTWEQPAHFCLPAATFADMVKKADKGAQLELRDCGAGAVEMVAGRTRGKIAYKPADDFPLIKPKEGEEAAEFALPAAQLLADLAHVAWAEGREETRYYLMGTALQVRDGAFYLAALDGHNCAWVTRDIPAGAEALPDSILPRKAGDILRRSLKGFDGPAAIATTGYRAVIEAGAVRLVAKLIDGTFPDWRSLIPADDAEMQIVGLPEAEPRLPVSAVEMVRKAFGSVPVVEMTEDRVYLTVPAAPEFGALAMLLKPDALPKGYAYEMAHDGHKKALEYLTGLATDAGLPQFTHEIDRVEYPEEAQIWDSRRRTYRPSKRAEGIRRVETIVDSSLIIREGLVIGATFGRCGYTMVEEADYETFTTRTVARYVGGDVYQEGSYSVAMPRERAGMAAAVTVGTPGVDERALATKNGAILLDAAAVARLAGDPADWERVEIKPLTFHHGRILPEGWRLPEPMMTIAARERGGKNKRRRMTDREVMDAYTADPAAVIAALQPRPTVEASMAVEAIADIAMRLSGWHGEADDEPSAAIIPFPAEQRAAQIAAEAENMAVEAQDEETAAPQPSIAENAPEAAQRPDAGGFEAAGEDIGAVLAAMAARIAALEAVVNSSRTQPETEIVAPPAAYLPDNNNFTRERRLRIVRAYLRLRRQRDGARRATELAHDMNRNNLLAQRAANDRADRERRKRRAAIRHALRMRALSRENAKAASRAASEARRAEDAEFKAADLARQLDAAQARLAEETARADSADVRWNIVLDDKQARIVALENELIELRSGGRIKLTPPLRANAQPVWSLQGGTERLQ